MKNPNDFVMARLTPAGMKAAGDHPLSVHGGRNASLTFNGDVPQQVHRSVWNETLRPIAPHYGEPWFELVTDVAPAAAADEEHSAEAVAAAQE